MKDAFGKAPSIADLGEWGRSYALYVRLLASPAGKMLVSRRARELAAPVFSHGDWGRFASYLQRAIDTSAALIEAAWDFYRHGVRVWTNDEIEHRLRPHLSDETIDPPGSTFVPFPGRD